MSQFTRTASIIVSSLSFKDKEVLFLKILTPIKLSTFNQGDNEEDSAASVCRVINLEDGIEYDLVCPTVMVMQLQEMEIDYVGNCYEVVCKIEKRPGKRYRDVSMFQIKDPGDLKSNEPRQMEDLSIEPEEED